jgi:hypothetical protein
MDCRIYQAEIIGLNLPVERESMQITVEFTGLAEAVTGERNISIPLPDNSSYLDIVKELAQRYPDLVGVLINPLDLTLLNATVFIRNGTDLIPTDGMDACPADGDHLSLLTVIVGG